jgi:2-polyprenyl-3-methyl-5-hydroxy-6-metoxy-1,4-benzoquinol methylase
MIEERVDWRKCPADPTIALSRQELEHLGDVSGKEACVLGSGDNLVVFALAGMGARVTSVDISEKQLDTASERATELGLEITFVRADVVDLSPLQDESFDLVYTVVTSRSGSRTSRPTTWRPAGFSAQGGCLW